VEEEEEDETEEDAIDRMKTELSENYENDVSLVTGAAVSSPTFVLPSLSCLHSFGARFQFELIFSCGFTQKGYSAKARWFGVCLSGLCPSNPGRYACSV